MTRIRTRRCLGALAALGLAGALLGCSQADRGTKDIAANPDIQDDQAPYIVNEPDMFMGLALKCVAGDLVVSHTRNAAPVVAVNSSACLPGAAEALRIPRVGGYVPPSR